MTIAIHFAGLVPGTPLVHIAWAAFARDPALSSSSEVHFGRELADVFDRHWRVVDRIENCDVVVYPHSYVDGRATATVAEQARQVGKPCLFFSQDETIPPSRLAYGTLYRSSIFKRQDHERCHPVFINDVRHEVADAYPETLPKEAAPRIGFCGYVGTPIGRFALKVAGAKQKVDGLELRARVLAALERDSRLRCEFIARSRYLGGATLAALDREHRHVAERREFLDNLFTCPYALAARGKGNHSVRFYEILSAGRLPLFVNTGCVLPLEAKINWRSLLVWVEASNMDDIGEHVVSFHQRVKRDEFIELQLQMRDLWRTLLRPQPFFQKVVYDVATGRPAP